MGRGRRATVKRVGAVAAGVLLTSLVASGVATAQARTAEPAAAPGAGVLSVVSIPGANDASSTSSTTGGFSPLDALTGSTGSTSTGSTSTSSTSTSSNSTSSTSTSSTSTSSTSSTSNGTYTITFPPTLPPGYGAPDGGHRYFGRYWDAAANCWRYASPNYVAPVVVATQVASVPKGGVNTGDGSFR